MKQRSCLSCSMQTHCASLPAHAALAVSLHTVSPRCNNNHMQVPEEKNKDGQWVPKGTKPALQLTHQQVGVPRHSESCSWPRGEGWGSALLVGVPQQQGAQCLSTCRHPSSAFLAFPFLALPVPAGRAPVRQVPVLCEGEPQGRV